MSSERPIAGIAVTVAIVVIRTLRLSRAFLAAVARRFARRVVAAPRRAAWAVLLGLLAGFLAGANLTFVAMLVAIAILNVDAICVALGLAGGLALARLLIPITDRVGMVLLDSTPAAALQGALGDGGMAILFGQSAQSQIGAMVIALLSSLPAMWLVARLTAPHRAFDVQGATRSGVLRTRAIWRLVAIASVAIIASWLMAPTMVTRTVLKQLTALHGAKVSADTSRLELRTGRLEFQGLRAADPRHPARDVLRVGQMTAQVRLVPLLGGHLILDDVALEEVRAHVAIDCPTLAKGQERPPLLARAMKTSEAPSESLNAGATRIDPYVAPWRAITEQIQQFAELVYRLETISSTGRHSRQGGAPSLERHRPTLLIKKLRATGLGTESTLGARAVLRLSDFTTEPSAGVAPARLEIVAPRFGLELRTSLELHSSDARHELHVRAYDLPLARFVDRRGPARRLSVTSGRVHIEGTGWLEGRRIDLPLNIEVKDLDVRLVGAERAGQLAPELWNRGLKQLGSLQGEARLQGNGHAPQLTLDVPRLVDGFARQLDAAGLDELAALVAARSDVAPDEAIADLDVHASHAPVKREADDERRDEPIPKIVRNPHAHGKLSDEPVSQTDQEAVRRRLMGRSALGAVSKPIEEQPPDGEATGPATGSETQSAATSVVTRLPPVARSSRRVPPAWTASTAGEALPVSDPPPPRARSRVVPPPRVTAVPSVDGPLLAAAGGPSPSERGAKQAEPVGPQLPTPSTRAGEPYSPSPNVTVPSPTDAVADTPGPEAPGPLRRAFSRIGNALPWRKRLPSEQPADEAQSQITAPSAIPQNAPPHTPPATRLAPSRDVTTFGEPSSPAKERRGPLWFERLWQ